MNAISGSLVRQFDRMWRMLEEAISYFPDGDWKRADHPFFVPARLALHIAEPVDYYRRGSPDESRGQKRFKVDWQTDDLEALPGRAEMLAYVRDLRRELSGQLRRMKEQDFLMESRFPWTGETFLEQMIYTLRHSHHHLGQLNAELKRRGLKCAQWAR